MKYSLLIEQTDTGYGGYVVELEGLFAVGDTAEEVKGLLKDILLERLEELAAEGKDLPQPTSFVDVVEVP